MGLAGVKALVEAMKESRTMTGINVGGNVVRDEGAAALAEAIMESDTLTAVNLDDCVIGNKGAKALAETIKRSMSLKRLTLQDNSIGKEGLEALIEASFRSLSVERIELFDFSHVELSDEMLEPRLEFEMSLGTNRREVLALQSDKVVGPGGAAVARFYNR